MNMINMKETHHLFYLNKDKWSDLELTSLIKQAPLNYSEKIIFLFENHQYMVERYINEKKFYTISYYDSWEEEPYYSLWNDDYSEFHFELEEISVLIKNI